MSKALDAFSERQAVLLSLALLGMVAAGDYLTSYDKPMTLSYLLPIYITAWASTRRSAMAAVALAMVAEVLADAAGLGRGFSPVHALIEWPLSFAFFSLAAHVVYSLKASLRREQMLAGTDFLTGLKNSLSFYAALRAEIARSERHHHALTLVNIDVDDFKRINDSLGHARGDSVLRAVAATIRASVRHTDVVARIGGDEFAVLLVETGEEGAQVVLEKLENMRMAVRNAIHAVPWAVTISVGAVTFADFTESMDQMLHRADELMYAAKNAGKNRISFLADCHAHA